MMILHGYATNYDVVIMLIRDVIKNGVNKKK